MVQGYPKPIRRAAIDQASSQRIEIFCNLTDISDSGRSIKDEPGPSRTKISHSVLSA